MPYHLRHYFDPEFDHLKLRPRQLADGSVDHYDLNYVQSVVSGQLLAEFEEIGSEADAPHDAYTGLIFEEPEFPAGNGTAVNPDNPLQLMATQNGYVFYLDGEIAVKRTLNVRHDVDFSTGNISFVGDIRVHGSIRAGFTVSARDIEVMDIIEAATVKAQGSLACASGLKGADHGEIEVGKSIKIGFCEKGVLKAGHDILVETACLHSEVYAGRSMAVKGRLIGGETHCLNYLLVDEQLGGGSGAETHIVMGYDPMLLYADKQLARSNEELIEELRSVETMLARLPRNGEAAREIQAKAQALHKTLLQLQSRRIRLWDRINQTHRLESCRIIVPGQVRPGVEISIGQAYMKIEDFLEDVHFRFTDNEIIVASPAMVK